MDERAGRAYVQRAGESAVNLNVYVAEAGLREMGVEIIPFQAADIEHLELSADTLVVGGIPLVHRALERLAIARPRMEAVPEPLAPFAGRRLWRESLRSLRARFLEEEAEPVFLKPLPEEHKWFNGHVARRFGDLVRTAAFSDSLQVQCSEVLPMVSEWRVFVHRRALVDGRPYTGDFRLSPDWGRVEAMREAWAEGAPVAYSLDVATTAHGDTVLVEVNDAYSLGTYGLRPLLYAAMLLDRWEELMRPLRSASQTSRDPSREDER